ncbi:MAG: molybdopterin-dependent oxidoreductase [Chloroflexota bacterium]|nr:molybdopterin-dependent oxidoreductase [Chloroflexota bacterium]
MAKKSYMILSLLLVALVLVSCAGSQQPTALEGTEIREYEGEKLSSINDFRENSIAGPQNVSLEDYQLEVTGLVNNPLTLTYDQVLDREQYSKVVTLYCVEGWDATILWEGVLVEDLLNQANVQDDAVTVIFHAADGYTSSLPLEYIRENKIMLAHKMNKLQLPAERGFPFQVVAESKWGYKWAKWVTKIELSDDPNYRGYWEKRGYNNDGDLSGPIFER